MKQWLLAAIADAAYWRKLFEDSNPDVGFGPVIEDHVDDAIKASGAILSGQERADVTAEVYRKCKSVGWKALFSKDYR